MNPWLNIDLLGHRYDWAAAKSLGVSRYFSLLLSKCAGGEGSGATSAVSLEPL